MERKKMHKGIFKKGLIIGLIILFIGVSAVSGSKEILVKNQILKDNNTPLMNFNVLGNPINVDRELEKTKVNFDLEEDKGDPQQKKNILIGPYFFVWMKMDVSTKEFRYINYNQNNHRLSIYIEFLAEDANDDSYIKFNSLISPFKPSTFNHKDDKGYDSFLIVYRFVFKKNVEYSNDRISITVSGLGGEIFWTCTGVPPVP